MRALDEIVRANEQAQAEYDAKQKAEYDTLGGIMAYEQGELDHDETVELFQRLVNSGLAWKLQGHYGRMAEALINAGYVTRTHGAAA